MLPDRDDVLPVSSGRQLYLAIVCCVWVLSAASAAVYVHLTRQDIALRLYCTMGEHEYNLARQRPVGPRSLELLIGLSASLRQNKEDQELVRGCIPQLVELMRLTSYRRLQFQAAWIIQQVGGTQAGRQAGWLDGGGHSKQDPGRQRLAGGELTHDSRCLSSL